MAAKKTQPSKSEMNEELDTQKIERKRTRKKAVKDSLESEIESSEQQENSLEEANNQKKRKTTAATTKDQTKRIKKAVAPVHTLETHEKAILAYIRRINEPFNAVDLTLMFQVGENAMQPAAIRRVILELKRKELIKEKLSGKSSVYMPVHKKEDNMLENDEEMEKKIQNLQLEKEELKNKVTELRNRKAECLKYPADNELLLELEDLKIETSIKRERIETFNKNNKLINPKEKEKLEKEIAQKIALKKKIKTIFKNILGDLSEGMNKKPAQIMEELGITQPDK